MYPKTIFLDVRLYLTSLRTTLLVLSLRDTGRDEESSGSSEWARTRQNPMEVVWIEIFVPFAGNSGPIMEK